MPKTPTIEDLAAALRDVLPYAYAHATGLQATCTLLGIGAADAERACKRCEDAAALLGAFAEPVGDMPPVQARAVQAQQRGG